MRAGAILSFGSAIAGLLFVACGGGGGGGGGGVACTDGGVCPQGQECSAQGVCYVPGSGGTSPFGGAGGTAGTSPFGGAGGTGGSAGNGGVGGSATCGNGTAEPPEECDSAGQSSSCDADCTYPQCGDGTANSAAGEQCDTSGPSATCDADCTSASCGDSTTNAAAGEECDTGGQSASCDSDCTSVVCGDGTPNSAAGEQCDAGGQSFSCDADCTTATCGDLTVNSAAGEDCDTGGQSASCDANCTYAVCGDGTTNPLAGEQCDDGGTVPGDGCSATCTTEVGPGDVCATAIPLSLGSQSISWSAASNNYLTTTPSCTSSAVSGPDVVLSYQATFTGTLSFTINKPTSTRWVAVADDGACGSVTSPLACVSDFSLSTMTGSISVVSGSTYWFYVADTTSGTLPLSNPFTITLTQTSGGGTGENCSSAIPVSIGSNNVSWSAFSNNYMPTSPSCAAGYTVSGPDVVLAYTAPFSGFVTYTLFKPLDTRWVAMASSVCGSLTSPLSCVSDFSSSSMSGSFSVTGGVTYYIHVADTTSGSLPLSNPFTIQLSQ